MFITLPKESRTKVIQEIPGEIGQMVGLEELYLSHNLSGYIPESIENMSTLYQLVLSFNHLDGKVPSQGVFRGCLVLGAKL